MDIVAMAVKLLQQRAAVQSQVRQAVAGGGLYIDAAPGSEV